MKQEKSKKNQAPFGARLLIMIYGAGIVMLGVHPIEKEFGSFWHFVEVKILGHDFDINNNIAKKLPRREIARERRDDSREKISWFSQKLASLKNFRLPSREHSERDYFARGRSSRGGVNIDSPKIKTPKVSLPNARARFSWPESESSFFGRKNQEASTKLRADSQKREGFLQSLFGQKTRASKEEAYESHSEHSHELEQEDRDELDSLLVDLP